ncbi:MAG: hypothetical protein DRJ51_01135 [Thermoprotei archaeon]|nr:MAG: hypothetical protein DRJ51_01135 [Thermoprotei archaeon]
MIPKKLVVIGLDAPVPKKIYELALKGELPNLKKLIEGGVYFKNCLTPYPTITPPNWTTIVTGAWIGTHGITCFSMHKPGMPLNETYPAFDSRDCTAEYIWQAAERVGKRTIIINWPTTWPPTFKKGVQIGGAGLSVNELRCGIPRGESFRISVCGAQLFTTEDIPLATLIKLVPASGWKNLEEEGEFLEARLPLEYNHARYTYQEPREWWLLVKRDWSFVIVAPEKDVNKAFCKLGPGEWSDTIEYVFKSEKKEIRGAFKFKLLKLSPNEVSLFMTPIGALDPEELPSYPKEIGEKVLEAVKESIPIPPHSVFRALNLGWIDVDTWLECIDMEHVWLAEAVVWLMKNTDWDLFFMHAHCPDWAYHAFMNKVEPLVTKDKEELEKYRRAEVGFYKSLDRMIGRILSAVDLNETLVIITSDHGAKPSLYPRPVITEILAKAGLLSYKVDEKTGEKVVDWGNTLAYPQRSAYIYVNLKGRDPHGIVDPKDYDSVRDRVIKALYDYTDPETGLKPILFALKKEDARIIGLYGDRIGDIVYALDPRFKGEHGTFLPTGELGEGSLKGLLIMAGPGIKKGEVLERTCWLTDIVPTVCHLMELPVPKHAEGGILYQALENPNGKMEELKRLREEYNALKEKYERLKRAFEADSYLTHKYE